jgi:hypothetical protein
MSFGRRCDSITQMIVATAAIAQNAPASHFASVRPARRSACCRSTGS